MVKAKNTTLYVCEQCGNEQTKWSGKCPACGAWNSLSQIKISSSKKTKRSNLNLQEPQKLSEVLEIKEKRIPIGIKEFDRVMGGEDVKGIVPGSVTLVAGEPGIGKSTLILQVLSQMSKKGVKTLYLSGEESMQQIKMRGQRLGAFLENIFVVSETDVLALDSQVAKGDYGIIVIDSIQTVENSNYENSAGSVTQIKESASHLIKLAKENNIALFIVGHITKEGSIAGPKILEHLVDTVLYFEGERFHSFRILRVVKNRFGAISEIGVFEMTDKGLLEIQNPSSAFISKNAAEPGQAICVTVEGTRPLLAEVQTLITKTSFGYPKRTASGLDINRLNILIAVMMRSMNVPLSTLDVYTSVAGGLRIKEPASDLAICVSILSSYSKKKVHAGMAFFGEVSLLGEVRPVSKAKDRINEAEKLGFDHVVVAKGTGIKSSKLQVIEVIDIKGVAKIAFES
jgi:DNA repair protein RadA/Sms